MDELEQKVLAAKADEQIFNELVESHKTWMLRVAHETTHSNDGRAYPKSA